MRQIWLIGLMLSLPWGMVLRAQNPTPPPPMGEVTPTEVNTVDGIIRELYRVISGPAGQRRDWNRMRSLFRPEARLNSISRDPEGKSRFLSMTIEDYIRNSSAVFEQQGFFEKEIGRRLDQYGDMAQAFSTYETRKTPDGPVDARGINSIQLVFKDQRYWILNLAWFRETPEQPIPPQYLFAK